MVDSALCGESQVLEEERQHPNERPGLSNRECGMSERTVKVEGIGR